MQRVRTAGPGNRDGNENLIFVRPVEWGVYESMKDRCGGHEEVTERLGEPILAGTFGAAVEPNGPIRVAKAARAHQPR